LTDLFPCSVSGTRGVWPPMSTLGRWDITSIEVMTGKVMAEFAGATRVRALDQAACHGTSQLVGQNPFAVFISDFVPICCLQ
jgi:hypothetical protein